MGQNATYHEVFKPFHFAIISDLHLDEDDGVARLERFKAMLSQWEQVAFVLLTGDIMWQGDAHTLQSLMNFGDKPIYALYGNNDWDQLTFLENHWQSRCQSFVYQGCLFVLTWNCMAANASENHRGFWDDAQAAWIEQQFADGQARGFKHLFLAAHVPPHHPDGYFEKFFMFPHGEDQLYRWCSRYHLTAAFFGHIHQPITWQHEQTQIIIMPSLNWNFRLINGKPAKTQGGSCRMVEVHATHIAETLIPVTL